MADETPVTVQESPSTPTLRVLWRVWVFALEKPAIFGAALYAYVTIIGLIYKTVYFGYFGIVVFDFYELQDFLLAGLRTPILLTLPPALVLIGLVAGFLALLFSTVVLNGEKRLLHKLETDPEASSFGLPRERVMRYLRWSRRFDESTKAWDPYVLPFFMLGGLVISLVFVVAFADYAYAKDRSWYCVELTGTTSAHADRPRQYVDTTEGFYFFKQALGPLEIIRRTDVRRLLKVVGEYSRCSLLETRPGPPAP